MDQTCGTITAATAHIALVLNPSWHGASAHTNACTYVCAPAHNLQHTQCVRKAGKNRQKVRSATRNDVTSTETPLKNDLFRSQRD